jgi:hypothetical protein
VKPRQLGQSLGLALRGSRKQAANIKAGILISRAWLEITGELMGRYCHPIKVLGKHLTVGITSPVWLAEAEYLKEIFLSNIRKVIGANVVTSISFSMLQQPPHKATELDQKPVPLGKELTAEEATHLQEEVARIHDPELREQVRRVLEKSLRRYR